MTPTNRTGHGQSDTNHVEHSIVDYLTGRLIESLTDRAGNLHDFPWAPATNVRVGVLGPTVVPPPPAPAAPASAPSNGQPPTAQPAGPPLPDNSGTVGVDFVVRAPGGVVHLEVDVSYALYHPLWAPYTEVQASAQTALTSAASTTKRTRPSVRVQPSWQRDQRSVTVPVTLTIDPNDEVTYVSPSTGPLAIDATAAVAAHYANSDALFQLATNQTLSAQRVAGSAADYVAERTARRDPAWTPSVPVPQLTVSTFPTESGDVAVSVSFTNALTLAQRDRVQDQALYDARMSIRVAAPCELVPQVLGFAHDDCRYNNAATVVGRGRGCVAVAGLTPDVVVAETLPTFTQHVAQSADPVGVHIGFASLAAAPMPTLERIAVEMRRFLRDWPDTTGRTTDERGQLEALRASFEAEVERFELGCDLLRRDAGLVQAFTHANTTFERARPGQRWRLFQLVFIVTELGALAARENPGDPRLAPELDAVDVLWFPTGGGKTEAYLGLIVVALFYDRLRGKERGVTAWLLFPLRMLSVQQLARMTHVIHHAEQVRVAEQLEGDPFALGYFVGAGNTPNRLARKDNNGPWPGLADFATQSQQDRDASRFRLVGACPACGDDRSIGLDTDLVDQRLLHVCRACGYVLPIHASDDEVVRYLPPVIVSTVDKITSFARQGELTSINRGPTRRCPQHGYHSHANCVAEACAAPVPHPTVSGFKDPTPALWVQDELHLVREDLGVFAAHYHTLMAELARGAGHPPSKVIAATATIEQYEDQLSQVYGRNPRLFPTGGPTLERSFYTQATDDVRRTYLGVLPSGGGTVKVDLAGTITTHLVKAVHDLTDDPAPLVAHLAASGATVTVTEAQERLFDYELALAYVNSKAHGVHILDDLHRLSERLIGDGSDRVRTEYLTGETTLGELAAAVSDVQNVTRSSVARADRIRALVGTSVVSHGVDLDRLNFAVMAGMPPSYAHYIQATARAGRAHVGLVVSVFDRFNRRETSMFQSFMTTHMALERMVEPVPVNRFAARAVERTLPGVVCALLWDETRDPGHGTDQSIQQTRHFQTWWNTQGAALIPRMLYRIARAYACPVTQAGLVDEEQRLVARATYRWEQIEKPRMENWTEAFLTDLFTSRAMTSLRDVTTPVEFSAMPKSAEAVERML